MVEQGNGESSDAHLIRRLQDGHGEAFDLLFERHRRGVFAYLRNLVRDRGVAEDITQECFIRLVRDVDRLHPEKGVSGWLYRVARNLGIDRLRRDKFEVLVPDAAVLESPDRLTTRSADEPDGQVIAREQKASLQGYLAMLAPEDRDILNLRYFAELKYREIAEVLERPLGTVLWQVRAALERLRARMRDGRNAGERV